MVRMRTKLTLALALAAAASVAAPVAGAGAQSTTYSDTAAVFQIGAGARPLAMGGAFVGVADDENALFYNPAGLASLGRPGLTSFYSTQYEVVRYGSLGLALRGFGIGALYLDSPGIQAVGGQHQPLPEFAYTNLAGMVAAAGHLGPLAVGVRGKYLSVTSARLEQDQLKTATGSGMAVDAAALLRLGPLGLGVVLENLAGSPIRYDDGHPEPWERRITAGTSLRLGPVLLAADLESLGGGQGSDRRYYHAGAELSLGPLALRGGATGPLTASGPSAEERDLTAGVGLRLGSLQVDYAYLMPADLPETHRLSLTLRF